MENLYKINPLLKAKEEKSFNLLDALKYLAFQWKWFALSILVFGGYYLYQYSKTPFMYAQSETVMIKTPVNTPTTARITKTNAAFNSVSVAGEILQLRSKELMRQTIRRIKADISYTERRGLREYELYKQSPIQVTFLEQLSNEGFSFTVTPLDIKHVTIKNLSNTGENTSINVPLNKEVKLPFGRLIIRPGINYSPSEFGKDIQVTKYPLNEMAGYFLANLKITQMEDDASLLQITVQDRTPQRAADLITTLISVYNEISLEDKNQIAIYTANFIRERLAVIESELGSVESNIEQLRTSNEGVDIGTAGEMYMSDSRQYQTERTKIETDQKLAGMMRRYLTDESKRNELIPNNTGLVEANVESQIVEYNTTLLRRNRLIEGSSVANPVVKDIDKALQSMRDNIYRAVDNAISALDIKIKNLQSKEYLMQGKAMQIPKKQRLMLSVERQQKVKEELYLYLLNKREENALNQAMTDDNVNIIDPASGSSSPVYPIFLTKMLLGIGIGVAIPMLILLLNLMLDTGIRRRRDIEEAITVPFLGEIPYTKRRREGQILVEEKGRDAISEAFRILRTNISFMAAGKIQQVITFTSFDIAAGKTFTAMNLATSFKFLNKKILMLDLDLRKGTLSDRARAHSGLGVTNFLADPMVSVNDIIYKNAVNGSIDLIPIGVVAPNPVELLLSPRLDELISKLKETYDYIIVDNVPVNLVADASIVNRISELTIFVIRAGKMDRRQLPDIQSLYEQGRLSNMAVLLNGIRMNQDGYSHSYGYGYGDEEAGGFWHRLFKKD